MTVRDYSKYNSVKEMEGEIGAKAEGKLVRMLPQHWPEHRNGGEVCDVIGFPCACGGVHFEEDDWVQECVKQFGWTPVEDQVIFEIKTC